MTPSYMLRHLTLITLMTITLMSWAKDSAHDSGSNVTVEQCLKAAPSTIFDLIEPNTLLDMIDYYDAGSPRHSSNVMGADCYVTDKSEHSISMVGGDGIEYQLFVLNPADACPIIGVITTVQTPMADSNIRFYDCRWDPLLRPILPAATLAQWMRPADKKRQSDVEEQIPFIMSSYNYDAQTRRLTLTNNMDSYYVSTDRPTAYGYIRDKLVYEWDGKKFKPAK